MASKGSGLEGGTPDSKGSLDESKTWWGWSQVRIKSPPYYLFISYLDPHANMCTCIKLLLLEQLHSCSDKSYFVVLSPRTGFLSRTASSLACSLPPRQRWWEWREPSRVRQVGPSLTAASRQTSPATPKHRLGRKRDTCQHLHLCLFKLPLV